MVLKLFIGLIYLFPVLLFAQKTENNFGELSMQWRTYYMNTINKGSLKDFKALATGGHLKYQYNFKGNLSLGAAVYNSTNTGLQDLRAPDQTTGKLSRYEEGLFNRLELENTFTFIAGELYAEYKLPKHDLTLGRMKFKSPLVNGQDGRMIPTLFQGLSYSFTPQKNYELKLAVFNKLARRSTGRSYSVG